MWVPHDIRDDIVDFVNYWTHKTGIPAIVFIVWLGIVPSKFYDWKQRYGKVNEHNSWIPRDFWLEDWEKQAIVDFYHQHPAEGYRRLTYMMLDADVVAVSPSSVYRVLSAGGLLRKWNGKSSSKGDLGVMDTCSLCTHWQSNHGLFALCSLREELMKFNDGCILWQEASESRAVCEYCGRPKNSPNYAYHICSPLIEKAIWKRSGAHPRFSRVPVLPPRKSISCPSSAREKSFSSSTRTETNRFSSTTH